MNFYNVPTNGAATRTEALVEFARRNTPEGRTHLTEAALNGMQSRLAGLCYQGDGGQDVYVSWAELTSADLALIVK